MSTGYIRGYTYRAENYCTGHIVGLITINPGDTHHREHKNEDAYAVEKQLDLLARIYGVPDREDEHTFDSDEFPKRIYRDQMDEPFECGIDGERIEK